MNVNNLIKVGKVLANLAPIYILIVSYGLFSYDLGRRDGYRSGKHEGTNNAMATLAMTDPDGYKKFKECLNRASEVLD